jgi:hypothetical protein
MQLQIRFGKFSNTPSATVECGPPSIARARFRITASAPYIPPLLITCSTLIRVRLIAIPALLPVRQRPQPRIQPVAQQPLRRRLHPLLPLQPFSTAARRVEQPLHPLHLRISADVQPPHRRIQRRASALGSEVNTCSYPAAAHAASTRCYTARPAMTSSSPLRPACPPAPRLAPPTSFCNSASLQCVSSVCVHPCAPIVCPAPRSARNSSHPMYPASSPSIPP